MRLQWNARFAEDFPHLLDMVPAQALQSPRRSVVPLLDFCRTARKVQASIGRAVGRDLSTATDFVFESAVPVQAGSGKPSYTDLLILSPTTAVAIEAKYTEPEYESVKTWLRDPPTSNRKEVLNGWLGLIATAVGRPVLAADVSDLPYQLIHRAASACFADRPHRAMAYLIFGHEPPGHYARHLAAFDRLTGFSGLLPVYVLHVPATPRPRLVALEQQWDAGRRDLADDVRAALRQDALFDFGDIVTVYWRDA